VVTILNFKEHVNIQQGLRYFSRFLLSATFFGFYGNESKISKKLHEFHLGCRTKNNNTKFQAGAEVLKRIEQERDRLTEERKRKVRSLLYTNN